MFNQFPRWAQGAQQFTSDYYAYNVGPGANGIAGNLAAAATANTSFTVQSDSNFEWWYTTFFATLNGATAPDVDNIQVPVSVLISDGGSGRQLFSQALPLHDLAGPGREPFVVPQHRIFMGKSTVNFFWNNFGAVQYNNISITLHGRKIFTLG